MVLCFIELILAEKFSTKQATHGLSHLVNGEKVSLRNLETTNLNSIFLLTYVKVLLRLQIECVDKLIVLSAFDC